jgi:hypothetical protein
MEEIMALESRGRSGEAEVWRVALKGLFRGRMVGRKDRNINRGLRKSIWGGGGSGRGRRH